MDDAENFDWSAKGCVTSAKDQKKPAVCWAFAATAAIEALNGIATGKLISLSEQYLIDCDEKYNVGFPMGTAHKAFEFVKSKGGYMYSDADYPYMAAKGVCSSENKKPQVIIDDYKRVLPKRNEEKLKEAVRCHPVTAVIAACRLVNYKGGILRFDPEQEHPLDHTVLIVGFGEEEGVKYWKCKNSWGPKWGEAGYFRIERNVPDPNGTCGIARRCYFPIIEGVDHYVEDHS